jgi:hypothetical protein
VGVQQNQQSNEMYNVRAPMPSWLAAEACGGEVADLVPGLAGGDAEREASTIAVFMPRCL